jgi:1-deoxy-D-xylulose-5-phosphate synthase
LYFLDKINSPEDMKDLTRSDLKVLAEEIRKFIIDVVSETGGHLASNLGVVELTVALHYIFDVPKDKIVWDVGHQSYAHKLLTGRRDLFHTLRQHQGLGGFTRISESPYDAFTTGHSSTSISASLGIAMAKKLKGEDSRVIAVIGDGSMTSGLAYEGLNQAGGLHKELIVILNDNEMSISKNVGALSSFLSRAMSKTYLQNLRREIGEFLKSVPRFGDDIYQFAKRTEDTLKTFVTPGMLFEAFNFDYYGPIDGHNLDHLIDILRNIRNTQTEEPSLIHVITKKGKGYPPAENNPIYFHGVSSFEVKTGNSTSKKKTIPTYTQVFGKAMTDMAAIDERIIAVTAAMPEGTGLTEFSEIYPDRFFDVGIAEQHGVTFAAGMATEGYKPVVAIYSTFLQRAFDQIIHDVCIESLHVVFAIDRGGIVGEDGATHHGVFDYSYLRGLPNMVVMAPKDENELCRMLATAVAHDGPIAMRYPRGTAAGVEMDLDIKPLPIGKGEIITEGEDILIFAIGKSVCDALEAQKRLSNEGISVQVVNCRFVKPLDADLIVSLAQKIPKIITAEENVLHAGFGSAVLECLMDAGVTGIQVKRIGIPDTFVEHGNPALLRAKFGIDSDAIVQAAKTMAGKSE